MSIASLPEIEYPESDGKPMAETDVHLEWMIYLRDVLKFRYRGQRVYVGSNLLVYYVEGDPRKSVAPDDFVVKNCDPGFRRTFRTWVEQRTPDVVFEVTSSSTRRQDQGSKPKIYARIGVKELFLYDPTCDYLDPPLQGFRFQGARKVPIRPDASGALESRELGLLLRLEGDRLVLFDTRTGERLLREAEAARAQAQASDAQSEAARAQAEAAQARAEAAQAQAEANRAQALAAEDRARAAEDELQRLREQLARHERSDSSSD